MSFFKGFQQYVGEQHRLFAESLHDMVSDTGLENRPVFQLVMRSIIKGFEDLLGGAVQTDFLVSKLSPERKDVVEILTPSLAGAAGFRAKLALIEDVFPSIKYTRLLFDNAERLLTCVYSEESREVGEFLPQNSNAAVCVRVDPGGWLERLSEELCTLIASGRSLRQVEQHFCAHAENYGPRVKLLLENQEAAQTNGFHLGPLSEMKSELTRLGRESYGFSPELSFLVLLAKIAVFPDTVVFFYPSPRVSESGGQGGIILAPASTRMPWARRASPVFSGRWKY